MENINKIRVQGIDYTIGPEIDSQLSTSSTNPVQNKVVKDELDKKQGKLTPGEGILIDQETNTISCMSGTAGIEEAPSDNKKYVRRNKSWEEETQVDLSSKQDSLVSGVNIKTINGNSILGEGNIEISGPDGGIPDAPSDDKQYVRKNGNWEEVSIPDINSKADKVLIESASSSSVELKPNRFIKFTGASTSITLTLSEEIPDILNEYMFQFNSGSTPTVINLPSSVRWVGEHTIESNKTYIISIISNLAVIGGA